jgi:alanine racemase
MGLPSLRATRAYVDLDALEENVRVVRRRLRQTTQIMAIVKADGYGHGAPWVADAALRGGAQRLGVATVSEGEELRVSGITAPIMVLGSIDPGEAERACQLDLEIAVGHVDLLEALQRAVRLTRKTAPLGVHLKIDTGMRRYGTPLEEAVALAERIAADSSVHFAGIFTHFASADEPEEAFTDLQLRLFRDTVSQLADTGMEMPPLHAANSAGILTDQGTDLDIVRLGIALYGVPPSAEVGLLPGMRPAMRLESRIARLFAIDPGDTVGYNRTFRAETATQGALLPIGYADGYRRFLSGRSWVGFHGHRLRVLGRISMDQMVVECPQEIRAEIGDVVTVMGDPSDGSPTVDEIAKLMATNTYEVLVGLRRRIPRLFVRQGYIVGVRAGASNVTLDASNLEPVSPEL